MKEKLNLKTLIIAFVALLAIGGGIYGGYLLFFKEEPPENGEPPIEYTWQTYHSEDFGFSVEYPKEGSKTPNNWTVNPPDKISPGNIYRLQLRNGSSHVNITILKKGITANMPTLDNNICNNESETFRIQNIPDNPNAVVGGEKAYVVASAPQEREDNKGKEGFSPTIDYYACLPHNDLFFEISYSQNPNNSLREDKVFTHVLEKLTFDDLNHSANIPDLASL